MRKIVHLILIMTVLSHSVFSTRIMVKNNPEVYAATAKLLPGDTMVLKNGIFQDIQLVLKSEGSEQKPIVIIAETPGKVIISGDAKVEMRGVFTELNGLYFINGNRNPDQWKSHGPGLIAMYASYCRVSNCAFNNFDEANSAYITTTPDEKGYVPVHCRIDHCSFVNKLTFDQVINFNNRLEPDKENPVVAPPMYHRVDHCFFSNPKKKGNAGGGIRIGYYRNALGRCLVDSNVFIRQDSEAEIITSKSMENVFFANTFFNCQGTLNFRHGDKQVAINNYFLSNDEKFNGYGGMFVWGSNHLIAGNYFSLSKTLDSRGNAAIYLNPGAEGSEHALAFGSIIANNLFLNNNGYAIHFNPMEEQRRKFCAETGVKFQLPHNISLTGNIFRSSPDSPYPFFKDDHLEINRHLRWDKNTYYGSETGLPAISGLEKGQALIQLKNGFYFPVSETPKCNMATISGYYNSIEGIPLDFEKTVENTPMNKPLSFTEILPLWMLPIVGDYYKSGKLSPDLSDRLKRITAGRSD